MPKKSTPALDVPTLAARVVASREVGKRGYKKADAAMAELVKQIKPGETVTLASGKKFQLKDNWEGKTQVAAISFSRRYELEEVTSP